MADAPTKRPLRVRAPAAAKKSALSAELTGPDGQPLPVVPPPPTAPSAPAMSPTMEQPGVQKVTVSGRNAATVRDPETGKPLTPVPPHMRGMVGGVPVAKGSRLEGLLAGGAKGGPAGEAQAELASTVLMVERFEQTARVLIGQVRTTLKKADGEHRKFFAAAAVLAEVEPSALAALTGDLEKLLKKHAAVLAVGD